MNKIEYKGKEILDLDKVKKAIQDTDANTEAIRLNTDAIEANKETLKTKVSSSEVKSIKVVNEYPTTEEEGVLYIKLES